MGRRIPPAYRDFLLRQNGGSPDPSLFEVEDNGEEVAVQMFFGLKMPAFSLNLERVFDDFGSRLPPALFPIAQDPGGNIIGVVEDGEQAGVVMYWDLDFEGEEGALSRVAPDFQTFLRRLGNLP
jgi:hypothetical protein